MSKSYVITPDNAQRILDWLANRGGVAVWVNHDLGHPNCGQQSFTPALTDGLPTPAPHWRYGQTPEETVTDASRFVVTPIIDVRRIHVSLTSTGKLRSTRAVRRAVDNAGPGAWFDLDYATEEAVIRRNGTATPLPQYNPNQP